MKKVVSSLIIIMVLCFTMIPTYALGQSLDDAMNDSEQFLAHGLRDGKVVIKNNTGIFGGVAGVGSLLTTIGIGAIIAATAILGIQYLKATPEKAQELKKKIIKLIIAALIIILAYNIWSLIVFFASKNEDIPILKEKEVKERPPVEVDEDRFEPENIYDRPDEDEEDDDEEEEPDITEKDRKFCGYVKEMDAWLYVPPIDYVRTYKNIPVIIYLRGGVNLDKSSPDSIDNEALPLYLSNGSLAAEAIVIAPRNPAVNLDTLINQLKAEYEIDEKNISITGFSTGAYYTIKNVRENPTKYSACIIMALRYIGSQYWVQDINIPTRFVFEQYHSYQQAADIAEDIRKFSAQKDNIEFIQTKGTNHGTVPSYYDSFEVVEWLTSHGR